MIIIVIVAALAPLRHSPPRGPYNIAAAAAPADRTDTFPNHPGATAAAAAGDGRYPYPPPVSLASRAVQEVAAGVVVVREARSHEDDNGEKAVIPHDGFDASVVPDDYVADDAIVVVDGGGSSASAAGAGAAMAGRASPGGGGGDEGGGDEGDDGDGADLARTAGADEALAAADDEPGIGPSCDSSPRVRLKGKVSEHMVRRKAQEGGGAAAAVELPAAKIECTQQCARFAGSEVRTTTIKTNMRRKTAKKGKARYRLALSENIEISCVATAPGYKPHHITLDWADMASTAAAKARTAKNNKKNKNKKEFKMFTFDFKLRPLDPVDDGAITVAAAATTAALTRDAYVEDTSSRLVENPDRGRVGVTISSYPDPPYADPLTDEESAYWVIIYIPGGSGSDGLSPLGGDLDPEVIAWVDSVLTYFASFGRKFWLRFAYQGDGAQTPFTDPEDADVYVRHIEQMSGVLRSHVGTLTGVQAGMIGPFGEWFGSALSPDTLSGDLSTSRRLVDAWLGLFPELPVQMRTPRAKSYLYLRQEATETNAVGAAEGVSDLFESDGVRLDYDRLGVNIDCFLSTDGHRGTYETEGEEENMLRRADTAPLMVEICDLPSGIDDRFKTCREALAEVERYRTLAVSNRYNRAILDVYATDGECWEEWTRRLGYRYVLDRVSVSPSAMLVPGGYFTLELDVRNVGMSAPANDQRWRVQFRDCAGAVLCRHDVEGGYANARSRSYLPTSSSESGGGASYTLRANVKVCNDLPDDEYHLWLVLYDANNPDHVPYNVQLANTPETLPFDVETRAHDTGIVMTVNRLIVDNVGEGGGDGGEGEGSGEGGYVTKLQLDVSPQTDIIAGRTELALFVNNVQYPIDDEYDFVEVYDTADDATLTTFTNLVSLHDRTLAYVPMSANVLELRYVSGNGNGDGGDGGGAGAGIRRDRDRDRDRDDDQRRRRRRRRNLNDGTVVASVEVAPSSGLTLDGCSACTSVLRGTAAISVRYLFTEEDAEAYSLSSDDAVELRRLEGEEGEEVATAAIARGSADGSRNGAVTFVDAADGDSVAYLEAGSYALVYRTEPDGTDRLALPVTVVDEEMDVTLSTFSVKDTDETYALRRLRPRTADYFVPGSGDRLVVANLFDDDDVEVVDLPDPDGDGYASLSELADAAGGDRTLNAVSTYTFAYRSGVLDRDLGAALVRVSTQLSLAEPTASTASLTAFVDEIAVDWEANPIDSSVYDYVALQTPSLTTTHVAFNNQGEVSNFAGSAAFDWTNLRTYDHVNGGLWKLVFQSTADAMFTNHAELDIRLGVPEASLRFYPGATVQLDEVLGIELDLSVTYQLAGGERLEIRPRGGGEAVKVWPVTATVALGERLEYAFALPTMPGRYEAAFVTSDGTDVFAPYGITLGSTFVMDDAQPELLEEGGKMTGRLYLPEDFDDEDGSAYAEVWMGTVRLMYAYLHDMAHGDDHHDESVEHEHDDGAVRNVSFAFDSMMGKDVGGTRDFLPTFRVRLVLPSHPDIGDGTIYFTVDEPTVSVRVTEMYLTPGETAEVTVLSGDESLPKGGDRLVVMAVPIDDDGDESEEYEYTSVELEASHVGSLPDPIDIVLNDEGKYTFCYQDSAGEAVGTKAVVTVEEYTEGDDDGGGGEEEGALSIEVLDYKPLAGQKFWVHPHGADDGQVAVLILQTGAGEGEGERVADTAALSASSADVEMSATAPGTYVLAIREDGSDESLYTSEPFTVGTFLSLSDQADIADTQTLTANADPADGLSFSVELDVLESDLSYFDHVVVRVPSQNLQEAIVLDSVHANTAGLLRSRHTLDYDVVGVLNGDLEVVYRSVSDGWSEKALRTVSVSGGVDLHISGLYGAAQFAWPNPLAFKAVAGSNFKIGPGDVWRVRDANDDGGDGGAVVYEERAKALGIVKLDGFDGIGDYVVSYERTSYPSGIVASVPLPLTPGWRLVPSMRKVSLGSTFDVQVKLPADDIGDDASFEIKWWPDFSTARSYPLNEELTSITVDALLSEKPTATGLETRFRFSVVNNGGEYGIALVNWIDPTAVQ